MYFAWMLGLISFAAGGNQPEPPLPARTVQQRIEDGVAMLLLAQDWADNWLGLALEEREKRGLGRLSIESERERLSKLYARFHDPDTTGEEAYVIARFPADWAAQEFFWIEAPEIPYAAFSGGSIRIEYPSLQLAFEEGLRCRFERKEFVYRGAAWYELPEAPTAASVVGRTAAEKTPQTQESKK